MNSEVKIILWGISTGATQEERDKLSALKSLTVLTDKNKNATALLSARVVIAHDGLPNEFQNNISKLNVWLINTGGTKSDTIPTEKNKPGKSIAWNTFVENIDNFLNQVKDKTEVTKEDIEVLYAIDPKLEELLTPFAAINPLSNKDLKAAKVKLQERVNELLKK